jgi:hypothetical protein
MLAFNRLRQGQVVWRGNHSCHKSGSVKNPNLIGTGLDAADNRQHPWIMKEVPMPVQISLELSYNQIGWKNVMCLLRAVFIRTGMLEISKYKNCFSISTKALLSEITRPAWIGEARELGLSDEFIAVAVQAAEKGISGMRIGLHIDIDPEWPIQTFDPSEAGSNDRRDAAPNRYLICDDWGHIFHDRYGEEDVRWIADWDKLQFIKVQVFDRETGKWEDAADYEHDDVVESLEQNGVLTDPEEWGLVACDDLPAWGH